MVRELHPAGDKPAFFWLNKTKKLRSSAVTLSRDKQLITNA
jgi:hypothetical protein